jgi:predicted nuclease of predicted toxin-antitoxin system
MFLLLDETIAKCLAHGGTLYTAQRSIDVRLLGRGAGDIEIFAFVRESGAVLVTQDGEDFAELVRKHGPLPVIVLPCVAPRTQRAMLLHVLPIAERIFAEHPEKFVEVTADGRVFSYGIGRR